jgi:hypothetical protein
MHHIFIVSLSSPRQKTNCHKWWLGTLCVAVSGAAETLCVFAFNSCWSASLSLHEARRVVGQATNRCCFHICIEHLLELALVRRSVFKSFPHPTLPDFLSCFISKSIQRRGSKFLHLARCPEEDGVAHKRGD